MTRNQLIFIPRSEISYASSYTSVVSSGRHNMSYQCGKMLIQRPRTLRQAAPLYEYSFSLAPRTKSPWISAIPAIFFSQISGLS